MKAGRACKTANAAVKIIIMMAMQKKKTKKNFFSFFFCAFLLSPKTLNDDKNDLCS